MGAFHFISILNLFRDAEAWVAEFQQGQASNNWAEEFLQASKSTVESDKWASEYLQEDTLPILSTPQSQAQEWVNEFTESQEVYESDFWKTLEREWLNEEEQQAWLSELQEEPRVEEYNFQEENPLKYFDLDHLKEGKKKLLEGNIPNAVLHLELACLAQSGSGEAWSLLGNAQARNENDPKAIMALRKAKELELDADTRQEVLLNLSASYANEGYQASACRTLIDWAQSHPKYSNGAHYVSQEEDLRSHTSSFMSRELHMEAEQALLNAARMQGEVDPDVQTGLGVLYTLSDDFDKAGECFQTALSAKPEDAQLWNRLGATMGMKELTITLSNEPLS